MPGEGLQTDMSLQVLPAGEKVRIVEVGSGSGGTSVVVMEALAHLGDVRRHTPDFAACPALRGLWGT